MFKEFLVISSYIGMWNLFLIDLDFQSERVAVCIVQTRI